jgi:hypothetical protein
VLVSILAPTVKLVATSAILATNDWNVESDYSQSIQQILGLCQSGVLRVIESSSESLLRTITDYRINFLVVDDLISQIICIAHNLVQYKKDSTPPPLIQHQIFHF